MNPRELERRIAKLPLFHFYFIVSLLATASIGLTFSIGALLENFYSCPVLNTIFIVFWFYAAICILQLCLGFAVLIAMLVIAWRQYSNYSPRQDSNHQAGCLFSQPNICFTIPLGNPTDMQRQGSADDIDRTRIGCCCRKGSSNAGWLQPVTIMTIILLVAHAVTLLLACSLQGYLLAPNTAYSSKVVSLFVEAKIQTVLSKPTNNQVSKACWNRIQHTFECCGALSYSDWLLSNDTLFNDAELVHQLPESCYCHANPRVCYSRDVLHTTYGPVFKHGCVEPLIMELSRHLFLLIITAPCCFVMVLVSFLADLVFTLKTASLVIDYLERYERSIERRAGSMGARSNSMESSC